MVATTAKMDCPTPLIIPSEQLDKHSLEMLELDKRERAVEKLEREHAKRWREVHKREREVQRRAREGAAKTKRRLDKIRKMAQEYDRAHADADKDLFVFNPAILRRSMFDGHRKV